MIDRNNQKHTQTASAVYPTKLPNILITADLPKARS